MSRYIHKNRLADSSSPYLRQHADNPVDWYPWGKEAFDAAKHREVPIFLSIGYSTCHWCHVMAEESFSSPEVAKILNENFVSIKVDREERPDVDAQYMTFVQMRTGGGGWPLSVFLTNELNPFFGGTYFPPKNTAMMPGFPTILQAIIKEWKENRGEVATVSAAITEAIKESVSSRKLDALEVDVGQDVMKKAITESFGHFSENFDEQYGGFGVQPKFPTPVNLVFLLNLYQFLKLNPSKSLQDGSLMMERCKEMVEKTLMAMYRGGIHDHVGFGFHRYAVDRQWNIPHFEKMLYDQAMLLKTFCMANSFFKGQYFKLAVDDIHNYVLNNLQNDQGAFFCAEDADSLPSFEAKMKEEGAFATWTEEELAEILGSRKDIFTLIYGNGPILKINQDPATAASSTNQNSIEEINEVVDSCLSDLRRERATRRPRPHRDEKILTEWNALLITAFCYSGQLSKAKEAFNFIIENHVCKESDKVLLQRFKGQAGFAADYAFFIGSCLDLYSLTLSGSYLNWATKLQETFTSGFWDDESGGFFNTVANSSDVVIRLKDTSDGALPSANSVATRNLQRLTIITGESKFQNQLVELMKSRAEDLSRAPFSSPSFLDVILIDLANPLRMSLNPSQPSLETILHAVFVGYPWIHVVSDPLISKETVQLCCNNVCLKEEQFSSLEDLLKIIDNVHS